MDLIYFRVPYKYFYFTKVFRSNALNFVKRELAYNRNVRDNLVELENKIRGCNTAEQFLKCFDDYPSDCSLKYKNNIFYILATIASILCFLVFFVAIKEGDQALLYLLLMPLIVFFTGYYFKQSDEHRQRLITAMENIYLEKKYGFEWLKDQPNITHQQNRQDYAFLFKKGNHKNDTSYYASGFFDLDGKQMPYTIFQYHYIDKHIETYRENGKKKERVVYKYYDSWGVFVSCISSPAFAITSYDNRYFSIPWSTSLIEFNERHSISGESEIELAKMLTPKNLLFFESFLKAHDFFELVSNDTNATLCLTFKWDILERENITPKKCISVKQLGEHFSGLSMPAFEVFQDKTKPLLNRMVG